MDIKQVKIGTNVYEIKDATARGWKTTTAPSASSDDTTIPTSKAVWSAISNGIAASDAMVYKGTIAGGSTGSYGALTAAADKGWTYKVTTAGKIDGVAVEVGDMLICNTDSTAAATSSNYSTIAAKWDFIQTNIDGAVIGPSSSTDAHVVTFNGTTGKSIKDSGFTIGKSVPSNAVFTDTDTKVTSAANHYSPTRDSNADKSASATGATAAWGIDVVKGVTLQTDGKGHVTNIAVTSGKIPANPNTDRYVNSASFADDTSNSTDNPVKMTLTRAGSDSTTVTANIPKVSASGAGVVPKGASVSSQSQSTKFLREDGTWAAPSYTSNTDTKVTSVGNHYTPSANANSELTATISGTAGSYAINTEYTVLTGVKAQRDAKGHVTGLTYTAQKVKDTNTTYSSKTAASGGTDVSLCTTGEKYTWNNKYSKPSGGIPASDIASGVIPTVAAWAQASSKPSYNISEITHNVDTYGASEQGGALTITSPNPVIIYNIGNDISSIDFSYVHTYIPTGQSVHLILTNFGSSTNDYSVSIPASWSFKTPDGQDITLTVPDEGYVEIDFLKVSGGSSSEFYVRAI